MSFNRERRGGVDQTAATTGDEGRSVGKQTLTMNLPTSSQLGGAVQLRPGPVQRAGEGAAPDAATMRAAASHGISGAGGELPHLNTIQRLFGRHEVGHVSAHVGGPAAEASRAMGAQAYATGDHVAFGSAPDLHTAAHEAAHVVQQRAGVHLKDAVGKTGDAYEQHADAVADKVVRGESAEGLLDTMGGGGGGGGGSALQLLATSGGDFQPSNYTPYNNGTLRGTTIEITFTPNDLVVAPKLGMTQTIKASKGGNPEFGFGPPTEQAERQARGNTAVQGDEGRHVDRVSDRTNPMYGLDSPPAGTGLAGTTSSSGGNARVGHRNVDAAGHVDMVPAWIYDQPKMNWAAGTAMEQVFETAALVMEGPMTGTYLGSVEWGVQTDAATGTPTTMPFRVISQGVPTQSFMASATNWNAQTMRHDDNLTAAGPGTVASREALVPGTRYPANTLLMTITPTPPAGGGAAPPPVEVRMPVDATFDSFLVAAGAPVIAAQRLVTFHTQQDSVDLPTTAHQTVDPATLSDAQLEERMRHLSDEILHMDRTTTDYQNKRFEIRALGRVAETRGHDAVDSGHTYTVKSGETLWSIAAANLGGGPRWTRIMALNVVELQDPNSIRAGAVLKMPQPYHP